MWRKMSRRRKEAAFSLGLVRSDTSALHDASLYGTFHMDIIPSALCLFTSSASLALQIFRRASSSIRCRVPSEISAMSRLFSSHLTQAAPCSTQSARSSNLVSRSIAGPALLAPSPFDLRRLKPVAKAAAILCVSGEKSSATPPLPSSHERRTAIFSFFPALAAFVVLLITFNSGGEKSGAKRLA
jgi:hypothetical protein